jgi:pimeloyl-ACP methyl ester carboxylesterase
MATYLLVHGAFHGGWCYDESVASLRAAGHVVHAPTLPGVAERLGEASAAINLSAHVADIVGVIERHALHDVILVGHSYGGMVITGVATTLGARIRTLVYLDAIFPENGQSLLDTLEPERALSTIKSAGRDGLMVPPMPASFFNISPAHAERVDSLMTAHPLATFIEAVRLTGREREVLHHTYIAATAYDFKGPSELIVGLEKDPAWRTYRVDCGHDIMIDRPDDLTAILLAEADR